MEQKWVDAIVGAIHKRFRDTQLDSVMKLSEYTVLASFCLWDKINERVHLLTLGSGTCCIGQEEINASGSRVHDGHAEIIAQRALKRLLYHLALSSNNRESCKRNKIDLSLIICDNEFVEFFRLVNNRYQLKPEFELVFYTSQPPCGDASIITGKEGAVMTGARQVDQTTESIKLNDKMTTDDHVIGVLRFKPGRGYATKSMSCSDKILRWTVLGVQGGLLTTFYDRCYISTFIYSSNETFIPANPAQQSIERALNNRLVVNTTTSTHANIKQYKMDIRPSETQFVHFYCTNPSAGGVKKTGCATSAYDIPILNEKGGIAKGRRQGVGLKSLQIAESNMASNDAIIKTSGKRALLKLASPLSKIGLFEMYTKATHIEPIINYSDQKAKATEYNYIKQYMYANLPPFVNWAVQEIKCFTCT